MPLTVDVVTGATPPKYTEELVRRLSPAADARLLPSKAYAPSRLGAAYRLLHHPAQTALRRRSRAILHVDSQLLAYLLALPGRRPRVVTCHDFAQFHPEYDDPSYVRRGRAIGAWLERMIRRGLRKADRVIAVSQFTANEFLRFGGDSSRVDVVPQGVDLAAYRPRPRPECDPVRDRYGIPGGRPIVLHVGSEHPRKNVAGLYRAFAQVRKEALLVRVGTPRHPQRAALDGLARSLGIANRVIGIDRVAEPDMPLLYGTADGLVLPSLYEGFGLPPLEAMACGTPVAVSKAASLPEVVGDAGLYFDPANDAAIASAIERILSEPPLREDLRAHGLHRAREFPWERTAQGVLASYARALATTGSEG